MAITLSDKYIRHLRKGNNTPNVFLEVALDSGTVRWGVHQQNPLPINGYLADGTHTADGIIFAIGDNDLSAFRITSILGDISSVQNKIDAKAGYSTRGQITFTIIGRDNFKNLIRDEYLKNRRVTRKDGFIATDFSYTDYAATFTGRITGWHRKGDELTITVMDDLVDATKKVPTENATKTQYLDYRNTHPVNIMTNLISTQLGIGVTYVNTTQFESERDTWLQGWTFDRVITEPRAANDYLNELQIETNSFIIHDGEKISYKVFAPPVPGQTIEGWNDNYHILSDSMTCKSGYEDNFYNRVVIYYDYDESGENKEDNFESAVISTDSDSQSAAQWNETTTKVIKSKWMRSRTYTAASNITGVVIYHVSRNNGTGNGTLAYTASTQSLTWTPPGGSVGAAVNITQDGKYQLFGADTTKSIRVIVTYASLPVGNQNDTITISTLNVNATALASKILNRYRNPVSTVTFDIDINNVAWNSEFIKPTDLKDLTTDEAFEKGDNAWTAERMMLTSIRPDFDRGTVQVEAIETRMYRRTGFIAPAGYPDYGSATTAQREYGFIGTDSTNIVGGTDDGYYVW